MKSTREVVCECYKESKGRKNEFVRLLELHGFREGFNGYEAFGDCVRVYVGAPDKYIGFLVGC